LAEDCPDSLKYRYSHNPDQAHGLPAAEVRNKVRNVQQNQKHSI